MSQPTIERLLPIREVKSITGAGATTIYRWIRQGRFPRQVQIMPGAVRWRESDVIAWQQGLSSQPGTT